MKGARKIRQLGFQETDIVSMARPITKATIQVLDAAQLPSAMANAFDTALSGRPGPVLLDIPMDIQGNAVTAADPERVTPRALSAISAGAPVMAELIEALRSAKRPLLLVGGGVRSARAVTLLRQVVDRLAVPVVHSLMGVDALGWEHPLRVGLLGTYGNRWTNHAIARSDLLLVLGSRLDVRQTGSDAQGFVTGRAVFHVDCDEGEVNNRVTGSVPIISELGAFFSALLQRSFPHFDGPEWLAEIADLRQRWPDTDELKGLAGLNPNWLLKRLGEKSPHGAIFVSDVGQHQMWAAQSLVFDGASRFLTSGGMGSMGFGLPAAIGAAMAAPAKPVVLVAGDGGFQSNIQELQTVVRNRLPIKIVIVNNRCHGMVRQFQESYFEGRFQSTVEGYDAPDFTRLAQAYGLDAQRVEGAASEGSDALSAALEWLWRNPEQPALLEAMVPVMANAYPKMAFGRPMTEMEPLAKPVAMEST
jgi:acetolactate synthase-1/2/3 large subunit